MSGWKRWTEGFPAITPAEVALVLAAVLLLYLMPALLAWNDARRRRRVQREHLAFAAAQAAAAQAAATQLQSTAVAPPEDISVMASEAATEGHWEAPVGESVPSTPAHEAEETRPVVAAVAEPAGETIFVPPSAPMPVIPAASEPAPQPAPPSAPVVPAVVAGSDLSGTQPLALQPAGVAAQYSVRLEELRQARLADWPPAVIRKDPERSCAWAEGERLASQHWRVIGGATIGSPYPIRSACLGAADAIDSVYRLRYLLFPVLWPVGEGQAVAQAVFEIDPGRGEVRGWVDALQPAELSEDHRREIEACGGKI